MSLTNNGRSLTYPSVRLRMDFRDPNIVGTFVYHCHILEHEDKGMMGSIRVDPPAARNHQANARDTMNALDAANLFASGPTLSEISLNLIRRCIHATSRKSARRFTRFSRDKHSGVMNANISLPVESPNSTWRFR